MDLQLRWQLAQPSGLDPSETLTTDELSPTLTRSNVTLINAATRELLRELTIDTSRDYQPTGRPKGPHKRRKPPNQ